MAKRLLCTFFVLFASASFAQTFKSTEGNVYVGRSSDGQRDGACITEVTISRRVEVSRDSASNRLIYLMAIEKTRSAVYRGSNYIKRSECSPGTETSSGTLRFYIENENDTQATYSATVIKASPSEYGVKLGERMSGRIEVFDGGRGLDFNNEDFMGGTARVLASSFRNSAGNEAAYFIPNRNPELTLSCKVISADGSTSIKKSQTSNSYDNNKGYTANSGGNTQSTTTNSACLAFGWENIRKTISIWTAEKRCDGYACEITPNSFKWANGNLSRITGQMKDACYTYECDKTTSAPRF